MCTLFTADHAGWSQLEVMGYLSQLGGAKLVGDSSAGGEGVFTIIAI